MFFLLFDFQIYVHKYFLLLSTLKCKIYKVDCVTVVSVLKNDQCCALMKLIFAVDLFYSNISVLSSVYDVYFPPSMAYGTRRFNAALTRALQ